MVNPSGKIYIGQSVNIERRIEDHRGAKCKGQRRLYHSLKKYGFENHTFGIIEECSLEQLDEREIYWGMFYEVLGKNGLCCKLGSGKGYVSDETCMKISQGLMGRNITWGNKISFSNMGRECKSKGIPRPQTHGKIVSKEVRIKISKGNKGKPKPGTGNKLRGIPKSQTHKDNISKASIGVPRNNIKVDQYTLDGYFIKTWPSLSLAAESIGVYPTCISDAMSMKRQKQSGGYIWKKHEEID